MAVSNIELRVDGRNAVRELTRVNKATNLLQSSVGKLGVRLAQFELARRYFKGFAEADKAAAAVRTLGVNSEKLQRELLKVSNETKGLVSQTQLLEASYDVASAGFNDAASAANILKAATLGAVGGLSDLNTVADATTSVLNAYGLSSDKASKIVDGFIQTQNDGKIVVAQYAQQIGRVAPIAAAAGVGIDDLNAAISAVTATGVPVESTFAGLRQAIASVIKPTEEARKTSELLGLEFSSAAIKTKGFGGFLADVIQKTGGSEVALTKLFGSVEAVATILPLANDGLEKFNTSLDNQKNSTGAAEKATKDLGGTVTAQVSSIINNIGNVARTLDRFLGPVLKSILTDVNNIISAVSTAISKWQDFTTGAISRSASALQFAASTLSTSEQNFLELTEAVKSIRPELANSEADLLKLEGALDEASRAAGRFTGDTGPFGELRDEVYDTVTAMRQLIVKRREALAQQGGEQTTQTGPDPQVAALQARINALLEQLNQKTQKTGSVQLSDAERLVLRLKEQAQTLEEQTRLAAAKTNEQRREIQLQIDLENLEKLRTKANSDIVDKVKKGTQALFDQQVQTENNIKADKDKADAIRKAQLEEKKRADELKNVYQGIGDTIADGVVNALKGAVDGTTSLADAATSLLNDLANQLLQVARNMLFFGNMTGTLTKGSGIMGSIFGGFMANGGTTMAGKSYIVGEKGPELFTPGVSGTVTPNNALGGSNIVVNVDASGSSVEGDAQQSKALGKAIGAAVQAEIVKQKMPGGLLN